MEQITANQIKSFRPYHPGELLKEELECRHSLYMTVKKQFSAKFL